MEISWYHHLSGAHSGKDMSTLAVDSSVLTLIVTGVGWRTHGEINIDIIASVNLVTLNQMGLYALPGY